MEPTDLSLKKSLKGTSRYSKKYANTSNPPSQGVIKSDLRNYCCVSQTDTEPSSHHNYQYSSIAPVPRDVTNLQVEIPYFNTW